MAAKPTKEPCTFAMAFQIERGTFGTVALAHALKSHVNALGLSWDDVSGTNNGQYAPFAWQGA
jgi:hypothetical protein